MAVNQLLLIIDIIIAPVNLISISEISYSVYIVPNEPQGFMYIKCTDVNNEYNGIVRVYSPSFKNIRFTEGIKWNNKLVKGYSCLNGG